MKILLQLGLKEYEARIYVALVGLGEANVRRIHETSGVPRPRVYDVLASLAAKGFIEIRQGSPLMYHAVRPDVVIAFLKKDLDNAARESVKTLETLSLDAQQNYSPIWYVHSDSTIQRNFEMLAERITHELIVLCFNGKILKEFHGTFTAVARDHPLRVLFPGEGAAVLFRLTVPGPVRRDRRRIFSGRTCMKKYSHHPFCAKGWSLRSNAL